MDACGFVFVCCPEPLNTRYQFLQPSLLPGKPDKPDIRQLSY
jgi:hypothetical protein